jgi:hypothetical protein
MRALGRWRTSDAPRADGRPFRATRVDGSGATVLDDDELEDDAPHGRAKHTHIWLPPGLYAQPVPQAAPRRTHDAPMPQRPVMRRGDQQGPEPGTLLCKIAQSGDGSGTWRAVDINGNALQIANDGSGWLEVRTPNAEENDPDVLRVQAPVSHDAGAGRAFEQRMSAALSPSRDAADRGPASLRGLSALLRSHYARQA